MSERRRFLAKACGAMAAAAATAITDAPYVIAQQKIQWRMSTTWTPALDVLQGAAQRLAKVVEEMSGGRFRIEVFPGGQIMPPFDCFDAASQSKIEAFMGAPYYWVAKEPAVEWFATIPFGMNPEGMAAWYYQGDGLKLWEETYAFFNLVPRSSGGPAADGRVVPPEDRHDRLTTRGSGSGSASDWRGSHGAGAPTAGFLLRRAPRRSLRCAGARVVIDAAVMECVP